MHSAQKNFRCFEVDLTLCTQVYTHMDVHKAHNVNKKNPLPVVRHFSFL